MLVYNFIILSFLLPIHSFFINPLLNPVNILRGYKKELTDKGINCSKIPCNCYILNKNIQKIQNITEFKINLNKTLALPIRWNDGEVPW